MLENTPGQSGIAENLKKGLTELLILSLLNQEDMHIYAIIHKLEENSGGVYTISFPYAAIYRLTKDGSIRESGKRVDENRLRQYYTITMEGKNRLAAMKKEYDSFIAGVNRIFDSVED